MRFALFLALAACGDNRTYIDLTPTDRLIHVQTSAPAPTPTPMPLPPPKPPVRKQLAVELKPAWRLAGLGRFSDGVLSSVSNMPTCEEWLKGVLDPAYPWSLATRLEAVIDLPPEVRGTDVTVVLTANHPAISGPIADHVGANNYHCKEPSHSIAEWRSGGVWQPVPREYTGSTYEVNGPIHLRIRLHGNTSTTIGPTTLIARWTE